MIPITIWIVEDEAGFRRTLQRMLNSQEHITCTQVFPSCAELFEAIDTDVHPDMLLMDLGLPGMGGAEGIQKLATLAPDISVVVLTVFNDKEKVLKALDSGAAGYLLKTATPPEIINGLQQVFMGNAALSPEVAKVVMGELRNASVVDDFNLTEREIAVLEQLSRGLTVKEISEELKISRSTVTFHIQNTYEKLQVHSQSGAVAKALRAGVI